MLSRDIPLSLGDSLALHQVFDEFESVAQKAYLCSKLPRVKYTITKINYLHTYTEMLYIYSQLPCASFALVARANGAVK